MLQIVADGLIIGSVIALGAIGLSMTMSIVRFSNFSHGEFLAWGAYLALMVASGLTAMHEGFATPIGPFSFGWGLFIAMVVAAAITALLALALDAALFKRLRKQDSITLVIASFGAALALRNLLLFWQGGVPQFFSRNLQIAIALLPRSAWGGLRFTPDQLLVLALTPASVSGLHLFLRYSVLGRSMRAAAINPVLAQATGIDPERTLRATWLISGALAAIAGVFAGITVQLRPTMGVDLLLPLFAAVVLGGVG
jgi:branched-chain amino acid transport system permease protein